MGPGKVFTILVLCSADIFSCVMALSICNIHYNKSKIGYLFYSCRMPNRMTVVEPFNLHGRISYRYQCTLKMG
uniref:Putative secreted protein n=1 Tax=Panstrongylus lignarius TaxID=156445 RepID=A0A224Y5Q0_9HEMI